MPLIEIEIQNFRNIKQLKIVCDETRNIFWGENGQGKTSLLEAINFLSALRSFKTDNHQTVINDKSERAFLAACFEDLGVRHKIVVNLEKTGKTIFFDGKKITKTSDIKKKLYPLLFSSDSIFFFRNFPSHKRAFFDRSLSIFQAGYLAEFKDYVAIIKQKKRLLKNSCKNLELLTWNDLLSQRIVALTKYRAAFVERLNLFLNNEAKSLFNSDISLKLSYRPNIAVDVNKSFEQIKEDCYRFLEARIESEKSRAQALFGSHLDRYNFDIASARDIKELSSGQYKAAFYALQFCIANILEAEKKAQVIFLMDDIFSDLDVKFKKRVLAKIDDSARQSFVATTTKSFDEFSQGCFFEVTRGKIFTSEKKPIVRKQATR